MMVLFRIMPGRYSELQSAVEGYLQSGVDLVASDPSGLRPAGIGDDLGLFYFVPKLVKMGFSLNESIQGLLTGMVFLAFLIGAVGMWKYCQSRTGKAYGVIVLTATAFIVAGIGDTYVYYAIPVIAVAPWWLYLSGRVDLKYQVVFCAVTGAFLGWVHLFRSFAGFGIIFFIAISARRQLSRTTLLVFALLITYTIPVVTFHEVLDRREVYLKGSKHDLSGTRPFWHNVYYSLGYLNNPYIYRSDEFAKNKALSINPELKPNSAEYEAVLKTESINFVKGHPLFFVSSVFAKAGVCFMYFAVFANLGLILSAVRRIRPDISVVAGLIFYSLFGMVTTPEYQYLTGLFAWAAIYNIDMVDKAYEQYRTLNSNNIVDDLSDIITTY